MPDWGTFAGFAGVVLGLLLLLAHASKAQFRHTSPDPASDGDAVRNEETSARSDDAASWSDGATPSEDQTSPRSEDAPFGEEPADDPPVSNADNVSHADDASRRDDRYRDPADRFRSSGSELSTGALLANVALSQALFGVVLLTGAWLAEIPPAAFGVTASGTGLVPAGLGVALGATLWGLNELGASVGDRVGLGRSEELRAALAPETAAGWAVLLLLVLPLIAGFEEFLFRGVLVGALSTGFGLSPWALAVASSAAFALGHGAQGPAGVVVTGTLGFVLAAAFVLTGSLLVVVVAHYLVNALEFLVHEWPWRGRT